MSQMRFQTKEHLTDEEVSHGLTTIIKNGMAFQAMMTLTGGVLLVAFAVELGASNFVIGLLAAIPFLVQLVQIPTIWLVDRVRNRRAIAFYAASSNRLSLLLIVLVPLVFPGQTGLIVLLIAILIHTGLGAVSACSWNSWMRDLVPHDRMGWFFSKRMALSIALGIVINLAAGFFIDWWKNFQPNHALYGYSILFFLGFVAGAIGVYFISRIPEPRMMQIQHETGLFGRIMKPFRDGNFRRLIFFLGTWNFAVNLAAPFFTVYMLKRLGMNLSYIIALSVLSQVMNVVFLGIWGRVADRFSNKAVLRASGPLFMFCILAWTFTTMPEQYFLTIPLLIGIHAISGISLAGTVLATSNISLRCAPKGHATEYLAANSLVSSLAAGIAPILGGLMADFFAPRELALAIDWKSPAKEIFVMLLNFKELDFLFFFAFAIGIFSIVRMAMVKEVGEIREKISVPELVGEVRRTVKSLSTIRGLRYMIQFPSSTANTAYIKRTDEDDP